MEEKKQIPFEYEEESVRIIYTISRLTVRVDGRRVYLFRTLKDVVAAISKRLRPTTENKVRMLWKHYGGDRKGFIADIVWRKRNMVALSNEMPEQLKQQLHRMQYPGLKRRAAQYGISSPTRKQRIDEYLRGRMGLPSLQTNVEGFLKHRAKKKNEEDA